jgi:hypothetical protein
MSAATTPVVNGQALIEICGFDRRLCAVLIATLDNWREILDSIRVPDQRKGVAAVVWQIREALGLEADYAREISSGRHE